jgi:hypothetical protein
MTSDNVEIREGESGEGRYLVAARDVKKGDLILSEHPLVAGPIYTRTRPLCLECLKHVGPDSYRCGSKYFFYFFLFFFNKSYDNLIETDISEF